MEGEHEGYGGQCTFRFVAEFYGEEVGNSGFGNFGCGDCVCDVVVAAVKSF
jgi:hypothetical protein